MNSAIPCPQCGNDEGIYVESCNEYGESFCKCHLCGFLRSTELVNNYYEDSETKSVTDNKGYGVMCLKYDESLELGYGRSKNLPSDADVESMLNLYDRFISAGVALPEKSYFTMADGKDVRFLRGDSNSLLESLRDDKCYCNWVLTSKGNSPCHQCL